MVDFLYPRVATIRRPNHQVSPAAGVMAYGGVDQSAMTTIATGIVCNVQSRGTGRRDAEHLPADATPYLWNVNIPLGQVAEGVIRDRDVLTDDLGRRLVIEAAYSHSMGWRLACASLEN